MPSQEKELKELIREVRALDCEIVDLREIAPPVTQFEQEQLLEDYRQSLINGRELSRCLIDVRSEKEFAADGLPGAVNIPILNNGERHKVGLLYKQANEELAVGLAYYFAKEKEASFLESVSAAAAGREILIYCWRGGGRSRYATGLLSEKGFSSLQLRGGQKEFRRRVQQTLYEEELSLIALSGLTGCGKSEVLECLQRDYPELPVLHLEQCAAHASSVFGEIRFELMGSEKVEGQGAFEQRLFMQFLRYRRPDGSLPLFLTEKESHKIGRLELPPSVHRALKENRHIFLECSLQERVRRLRREYFGEDDRGREAVKEKIGFLYRYIGHEGVKKYRREIDEGFYEQFLEDILLEYYDRVYRKTEEEALLTVHNDDSAVCAAKLFEFLRTLEK
jgi:tRNA 2-selenouridine synthase